MGRRSRDLLQYLSTHMDLRFTTVWLIPPILCEFSHASILNLRNLVPTHPPLRRLLPLFLSPLVTRRVRVTYVRWLSQLLSLQKEAKKRKKWHLSLLLFSLSCSSIRSDWEGGEGGDEKCWIQLTQSDRKQIVYLFICIFIYLYICIFVYWLETEKEEKEEMKNVGSN